MFTDNLDLIQQGFIHIARDQAAASIAKIPENRTLLLTQLTDKAPPKTEMHYDIQKIDDVFNKFKPAKKIEFQDESGASVNETMEFKKMGHFNKKELIARSKFLAKQNQKQADHETFARRLQSNRSLQAVLNDPEKKAAYLTLLKSMIEELS